MSSGFSVTIWTIGSCTPADAIRTRILTYVMQRSMLSPILTGCSRYWRGY